MSEAILTLPECAKEMRISTRKLAQLTKAGEIRSVIIGKRSRRILRGDLNAYLARLQAAAAANELPEPQTAEATATV